LAQARLSKIAMDKTQLIPGTETLVRKLHIAHVVIGLGVGGAERILLDMAQHADDSRMRTTILCMTDETSLLRQYDLTDENLVRLGLRRRLKDSFRAFARARTWIQQARPDILHAHMFHALCLALLLKLFHPRLKLVFTSHNASGHSWLRRAIIRHTQRWRAGDTVFFEGQHPELNARRTHVIPNGVPLCEGNHDRAPVEPPALLFLGRFDAQKNPLGMIASFEAMQRQDCELWLAGDGIDRAAVQKAVSQSPARARIQCLGVIHDVPSVLRQCAALVLHSRWEGLPLAILEAGARAVPVVATPVGAVPLLLADGCGYLADEGQMASVLDALLDDRADAEARGLRLRARIAERYSLKAMTEGFAQLYAAILTGDAGGTTHV
jgi:glycosyltransferase involved in cell wall biosynthesis